jgi:hypothetical protein
MESLKESGLKKVKLHHKECKKLRKEFISNTCDKEKIFYDYCLENRTFW